MCIRDSRITGPLPQPPDRREVDAASLTPAVRKDLLDLARSAIATSFVTGSRDVPAETELPEILRPQAATFVTLRGASGELLGCIGTMEPSQAIGRDVAEHALAAAFDDPRFPALTEEQLQDVTIDISVLQPMRSLPVGSYHELVSQIPPGSGVLVREGFHHATYLPSVWREVPDAATFIAALWRKAGLRPGSWGPNTGIWVYDVTEFGELD